MGLDKDEMRRWINQLNYPRRKNAVFTADNDHNPLVLQDCHRCHGRGKTCLHDKSYGETYELVVCPDCQGAGITGEVERYFDNDEPAADAATDAEGWLTCPNCNWRFTIRDRNAWTGLRHFKCGQKIHMS